MRANSGATARAQSDWAPDELETVRDCPICGSPDRAALHEGLEDLHCGTRGRWIVQRCRQCGSGYLDPRPNARTIARAYERYFTHAEPDDPSRPAGRLSSLKCALRNGYVNAKLGYRLAPAAPLSPWVLWPFPIRRRHALRLVSDLPYRRGRLLDVGSGNGRLLVVMRWAGWEVEGVEPDESAVAAARGLGLTVHAGTLADVDLPDRSYDAITMEHVLEHMRMPGEALEQCRRLLRPDGFLWLATPNFEAPAHRAYGADWVGLDPPRHLVLLTATSLETALESAGFEPRLLPPPGASWMRRQSEEFRARRRGHSVGRRRRLEVTLTAAVQDVRARRDPRAGEELIVLATPTRR